MSDFHKGRKLYQDFHEFPPPRMQPFHPSLRLPQEIPLGGIATSVSYRSDKWHKGKHENYIHEHDGNVKCYVVDGDGPVRAVPQRVYLQKSLVCLGDCLEFTFARGGDEYSADFEGEGGTLPELFCTPDGRCLAIIDERRWLLALVWGGKLGVEDRGIVG